jgi:hypothetical protein
VLHGDGLGFAGRDAHLAAAPVLGVAEETYLGRHKRGWSPIVTFAVLPRSGRRPLFTLARSDRGVVLCLFASLMALGCALLVGRFSFCSAYFGVCKVSCSLGRLGPVRSLGSAKWDSCMLSHAKVAKGPVARPVGAT